MNECGIVQRVEGSNAWVTVVKGEQCEGCQACSAFGEGSAELVVKSDFSIKPGDKVEIEIDPQQVVRHSIIVFLLPVFGLVLGYFLGTNYLPEIGTSGEAAGIIGSIGTMILTFVGIALYDRVVVKKQDVKTRVIRVLSDNT
ncbi:hypothetical protein B6I21_03795 [candidate division KSB1 bacterium 4572_119]|nr:MAG: hypothetical protein B6I21_03795 [candidate division KSB1 bacterium 4572_119]